MNCLICGLEEIKLHTHHIIPKRFGGQNTYKNRVKLCATCHRAVELNRIGAVTRQRFTERGITEADFHRKMKEFGLLNGTKWQKNHHLKKT